jgi:hypothetical protein
VRTASGSDVAFWASLTCSTVWSASDGAFSTVMATVWLVMALIVRLAETRSRAA